jgi:hypothetical protein
VSASFDCSVKIWDTATGKCLQTFKFDFGLFKIAFDPSDSYLLTELGPIALQNVLEFDNADVIHIVANATATTITGAEAPQNSQESQGLRQYSYGLSLDKSWITLHGLKVLWLPSEYRPTPFRNSSYTTVQSTVAIGCPSGRVIIISFSPTHHAAWK